MEIGIPKEIVSGEQRVTATPETVGKLVAAGYSVLIERGAGLLSHFRDEVYKEAGGQLVSTAEEALRADLVLKIHKPSSTEISQMTSGAILLSYLDMCHNDGTWDRLAQQNVSAIALEMIPRISRAQNLDTLSSQANISGYRAVLEATRLFARFFPMMMTSAGSVKPARVVIIGAGVAGLQAIATAKRLGAQVWAYDVRPEVKEQIQSVGAKFIELDIGEDGTGEGGYAKELSQDAQEQEQRLLTEQLKQADIIISTAQIPCMPAPVLITEEAVNAMCAGAVIIDMAAASGGNCPLTEVDKTLIKHGVILCGITNFPSLMPTDASNFFARNLMNMVLLMKELSDLKIDITQCLEDEIISSSLITHGGKLRFGED